MMDKVVIYELDGSEISSLGTSDTKVTEGSVIHGQLVEKDNTWDNKCSSNEYVPRNELKSHKLTTDKIEVFLQQIASLDAAIFPGNIWGLESYRKSTVNTYDYLTVAIINKDTSDTTDGNHTAAKTIDDAVSENQAVDKTDSGNAAAIDNTGNLSTSLAGFALLRCFDDAELIRIAVEPGLRRQGIGEQLLNDLLQEVKKRDIHDIFLEVRSSNEAAIGLYTKAGFVNAGIRKGYYSNPAEDAIIMRYTW